LRMLMSTREIQSQYDPHEGDRYWAGTEHLYHAVRESALPPRERQVTDRPATTSGSPNRPLRSGQFFRSNPVRIPHQPETDTELYQRKYLEAENRGLVSSIQEHGVTTPIPLTTMTTNRNPHLGGEHGKPMVGGGQHRLAVMQHLNPDQLLPVVHVQHVFEAKDLGL
jgi:hypothetical protein